MTIANKYALLFFKESAKNKSADKAGLELSALEQAIFSDTQILGFFKSPGRYKQKQSLFLKVASKYNISTLTINLMKQIIKNDRISLLSEIASDYEQMLKNKKLVQITSARAIEKKEQATIEAIAQEKFGDNIELEYNINEDLIGGIIMRYGNKLIDASIKGGIARTLRQNLS